jgi:hypothetical protein
MNLVAMRAGAEVIGMQTGEIDAAVVLAAADDGPRPARVCGPRFRDVVQLVDRDLPEMSLLPIVILAVEIPLPSSSRDVGARTLPAPAREPERPQ